MIVKSGDDLRCEQFAMQLIDAMDQIFKKSKLKLKLSPYEIQSTGLNCGIIEFISDVMSIDGLKSKFHKITGRDLSLAEFYKEHFK